MATGQSVEPVDTVPIGEIDLAAMPPGRKWRCWLQVATGLRQPVMVPFVVARGVSPGPTVFAVAGVHGNEYEGMEAIRATFAALDVGRLAGTFAGIPVANPYAYAARSRTTPLEIDGLNLARIFPGNPDGSPSAVLADHLFRLIGRSLGPDDLLIDFHSGSAEVAFATIVGVRAPASPARARSEAAARHFGLPALWEIPDSRGPLNAETTRAGIPTIGTETTGRAGFDARGFAALGMGLARVMAYLGMIASEQAPVAATGPFRPTREMLAPSSGFFRTSLKLHDEVEAGELLGSLVDIFGDRVAEIQSPCAGSVWAVRETCAVESGETLCYIALR